MRPRKTCPDLPKNVYLRHGAYYHVKEGKWHRLGSRLEEIQEQISGLPKRATLEQDALLAYAYGVLTRARNNAKGRRGLGFSLTRENVLGMLIASRWRCAVTRTPFTLEEVGRHRQKPYAPSIDRIDCAIGYTPENCRVVCVATNFAMNTWGEAVLRRLARNMVKVLDSPKLN